MDLRNLGDRWDVVLAGGQRFGPGEITFVLTYFADYVAAGHLAPTQSPELGELIVFNWTPVQWDEPLEHSTVQVSVNDVQGTHASGLTVERNRDAEVEVIVIRQPTTKTSGYHTEPAAVRRIAHAAWASITHVLDGIAAP